MTVLVSSHLLSEIDQMATYVGIISKGSLVFQDKLASLHEHSKARMKLRTTDDRQSFLSLKHSGLPVEIEKENLYLLSDRDEDILHAGTILSENKLGDSSSGGAAEKPGGYFPQSYGKEHQSMSKIKSGISSSFTAEQQKQRRRRIWIVPLGFLVILFLWAFIGKRSLSAEDLARGYSYTLYQFPLLNVVLVPVMTAVIASRLCDMEIKGNTLKLLCTLQKRSSFYDWKFIHELKYLLIYLLGGMGGNLLCLFLELDSADFAVSAGASGAVFAVMGAMIYAVIRGRGHIEDLSARQVVIMAAFSLYFGFTSEGVDNAAHVGGLICGFLLAVLLYHPSQRAG